MDQETKNQIRALVKMFNGTTFKEELEALKETAPDLKDEFTEMLTAYKLWAIVTDNMHVLKQELENAKDPVTLPRI